MSLAPNTSRPNIVWATITLVAAVVAMAFSQGNPIYTPDSVIYASMMLGDLHVPAEQAKRMDDSFFAGAFASDPSIAALVGPHPPQFYRDQFPLFISRPVYPYLSSLLFGKLGYRALPFVSSIAFVLVAVTLFFVLRAFGPAWLAAVVGFGAVFAPLSYPSIYELGTYGLTDLVALFFSLVALLAQIRYTVSGARRWLVPCALATIALAATRPAVYLVGGAAVAVILLGWLTRNKAYVKRGTAMTAIAFVVTLGYMAYSSSVHAPGLVGQIKYYYEVHMARSHYRDLPLGLWYCLQVGRTIVLELADVAVRPASAIVFVLGLAGLYLGRRKPEIVCVIGAMLSLFIAVLTHPVPGEQGRPVEVPMIPILAIGIVSAIAARLPLWSAALGLRRNARILSR